MSVSKFIGGILLIVGTSVGGGMLALPVATSDVGFINSILFLVLAWLVMTAGAFLILEVNLRLPPGSNIISMAKLTLGVPGQIIAWIAYLFLLYSLISAYIAGGSDILNNLLSKIGMNLPSFITALLFTTLFGLIVYGGIRAVDYFNRGLMFGKLGIYVLLIIITSPYINKEYLQNGTITSITSSLMILIAAFGFASIVPSLRDYFKDDIAMLRKVIVIGSLIPLLCYILWDAAIMGVIQRDGESGLISLKASPHATSGLMNALSVAVNNQWISVFFNLFSSLCMITAFLAVSIGLFDFLADGLKLKKSGIQGKWIMLFTFAPPLSIVLFTPGIYLTALRYAGVCCVILLIILPALMTWRSRTFKTKNQDNWCAPGGVFCLGLLIIIGILLLIVAT